MNNPHPFFSDNVAQSSPSSDDNKLFPTFLARVVTGPAMPSRHRSSYDGDLDKKPAANSKTPQPEMPAGVEQTDVLCGRDKLSHAHIGNKHFRKIIESHREPYQNAQCRDQKTNITCQVIAQIHNANGRFLKLNDTSELWEEVTEQYAREKVSHALRSAKDPSRPRIKKPRKTKQYVPTEEEDAAFEEALKQQKDIFQTLLADHIDSDGSGDDASDQEGDKNGDSQAEADDWDFYQ